MRKEETYHLRNLISQKLCGKASHKELQELEYFQRQNPDIEKLLRHLLQLQKEFDNQLVCKSGPLSHPIRFSS
jgi:hypothetical protein